MRQNVPAQAGQRVLQLGQCVGVVALGHRLAHLLHAGAGGSVPGLGVGGAAGGRKALLFQVGQLAVQKVGLLGQAAGAVQWVRTIERMKAAGITDIVECGPGKVLTGLLRRTAPEINGHNIFDAASLAAVLEKLN